MINRLIFLILFASLTMQVVPQQLQFPEFQGYRKLLNYPVFSPDNLWDFIDGAADTYLSYGFQELHVAEYQKGRRIIKVEVYRHSDNTQAFGIYSAERSATFRFINVGAQGYRADGSLNFFKGSYYVKIRTSANSKSILQMLETVAARIAEMLAGDASMPKLLSEFPDNGRKLNEEIYINKGVLGHAFLEGAFRAQYESAEGVFSIYLIDNPTAAESSETVNAYLSSAGLEADDQSAGKVVFRDGYNGDIFLIWKDNRIVIIQGLAKDQTGLAERYASEMIRQ